MQENIFLDQILNSIRTVAERFAHDAEYRKSVEENGKLVLADLYIDDTGSDVAVFQNTNSIMHYVLEQEPNRNFADHELEDIVAGLGIENSGGPATGRRYGSYSISLYNTVSHTSFGQ